MFDQRRNWFQITCQADDEPKIKRQLKKCLEDAEELVLEEDEDLVDEEGALVVSYPRRVRVFNQLTHV